MKEALATLAQELHRRYRAGDEHVVISDHNWDALAKLKNASSCSNVASTRSNSLKQQSHSTSSYRPSSGEEIDSATVSELLKSDSQTPAIKAKSKPGKQEKTFPPPPELKLPEGTPERRLQWLREQLMTCAESLSHVAADNQLVFGKGNPQADLFFVGEAPGAEEAACGEPFVGPAGELLDKMIKAMGLQRDHVYIANILTWRPEHDKPTGNRPPTLKEMEFCLPYLKAQIEIVSPKVLVALGNSAVNGLLGPDPKRRLTEIRGHWHTFADVPLMVTFHPAYLLQNNTNRTKRMAWEDLLAVMERLKMPISERQRGYFKKQN